MITPTKTQVKIACTIIREELTAMSGFINYNDEIADEDLERMVTKVLNGVLNVDEKGRHI